MNLSSIKNSIKNLPRRKKIAILGSTVLVIGAILGVSVAQQNQDNRSKAAAPMQDGYQGIESVGSAGSEPEVVPGEVLIKLKSTANSVVPDQVNAQNPGRESLRQLNSAVRAERFERIFERRQGVLQQSQPDTSWYKVKTTTATSLPKAISRSRNPAEFNQVLTLVEQYKKDPDVEIAEPNYVVRAALTPNDPEYAARGRFSGYDNMWGLKKINMASAWDQSTGNNIVVAVIDSGVDRNHPDISANMTNGWDFVNNDSDPNDDNGHGTHVAGILGATGNNGNKIPGANWRVKIMAIKVLNNTGSGSLDNISKGLRYAADNGAKISNISIGCNCTSQIFNDTVNYAHDRGMTVVAAAGNDNRDVSTNAIANATWAITVGATDPYDQKASFSNFGPKIDVVAPGINILSIVSNVSPMCGVTSGGYNYVCWHNGTSFAAPHVAGLAALMLSKKPSLTHEDIRQILRSTAQDLGTVGRDTTFGSGRIDAGRAMAQVAGTSGSNPTPLPPQPTTAPTNPPTSSIPQSFTTASLIAAVNGCGSAYVKAGDISGPWYQQTKCSDAKVADASGSWVTVINGAGGLFVKRNSASGFSQVLNNGDAKAVAISNNRLGIINGCGAFYVKEGDLASTAGRVLQTNCGDTKAMDVSDSWIAVINSASELWVKRGITGAFTKILNAGDAQAVSVSNNRIGVITGCGASYVREGDLATASWQLQTNCGDAKSIDVSDNRVAVINGCGALYAKDGALSGGFRLLLNCGDAKAVSVSNGLIAATNNSGALYYRKSLSDGWSLLLNPGDVSNFKVAK